MLSNPSITPAGKPPSGVTPNFVDPPSAGHVYIALLTVILALSTPFVFLRIYTRQVVNRKVWWDDWTCLLGWAFMVALCGLAIKALSYGGGIDTWNVPKSTFGHFTKLFHNIEIVARIGMFFTKVSILLLFQRLFLPKGFQKNKIFWAIWFVFWWNLLYAVALVIAVITECVGKEDKVARGEQCINQYAVVICASVINVVSDLMILVIPLAAIGDLKISRKQNIRLSAVFAVGILGVLASVARLAYQVVEDKKPNQTQIILILTILNLVEQMMGIIVGCMPVLPALVRHWHGGTPSPYSSAPISSGVRKTVSINISKGPTGTDVSEEDPYMIRNHYEELGDIDANGTSGSSRFAKSVHVSHV